MENDRETVKQLVKKLKEEIKHINAFVIIFNGQVLLTNKYVNVLLILLFLPESEVHIWPEKYDQAL